MDVSDLSQIQRRPGPGLTLLRLHDAEDAKRGYLEVQLQSMWQLHSQVTASHSQVTATQRRKLERGWWKKG